MGLLILNDYASSRMRNCSLHLKRRVATPMRSMGLLLWICLGVVWCMLKAVWALSPIRWQTRCDSMAVKSTFANRLCV
jgi:hypothetical protein